MIGSWPFPVLTIADPRIFGAHAAIYTDAARTWLAGGNPWLVGPEAAIFAGPPPMLLPYVPFISLPLDLTRFVWVVGGLAVVIWALRRLGLPAYFTAFPPIFQVVVVGHLETLVLGLLVAGGAASGLVAVIKPYAGVPVLAERRWRAFVVTGIALAVTAPFLPWERFIEELPRISENLAAQATGDSVFGQPLLMVVAIVSLASLGLRRGLWLSVPLLWPFAQPTYKAMTLPALSPVLALFWAIPLSGSTIVGIVVEASLIWFATRRSIPTWLGAGLGQAVTRQRPGADRVAA